MDIRWWLKKLVILIVVCEITTAEGDLLESLRPRQDNPPEVNEFLMNVLQHKDDFDMVRRVASSYHNMKFVRDVEKLQPMTRRQSFNDILSSDDFGGVGRKRHAPFLHRRHHKHRKRGKKKHHRHERNLPVEIFSGGEEEREVERGPEMPQMPKKNPAFNIIREPKRTKRQMYEEIVVEPEGEKGEIDVAEEKYPKVKKAATDFDSPAVHMSNRGDVYKTVMRSQKVKRPRDHENFYYVDLGEKAENEPDKRNNEQNWYSRPRYYYRAGKSPIVGGTEEKFNYPMYGSEPRRHNFNDDVEFEKALSYEIEPKDGGYNNPDGNNLYSVDEGRPDNVQLLNFRNSEAEDADNKDMTDERFFIDVNNNLQKSDKATQVLTSTNKIDPPSHTTSVTVPLEVTDSDGAKMIKQVGDGFIEITKGKKIGVEKIFDISKSLLKPERMENNNKGAAVSRNVNYDVTNNNNHNNELQAPSFVNTLQKKNTDKEESDDAFYIPRDPAVNKEQQSLFVRSYSNADDPINVDSGGNLVETKDEERRESNVLAKNSLHPLRLKRAPIEQTVKKFYSRKLQFIDDRMIDTENDNEDYGYVPKRRRRDFLDALGMKNEEDYSEDNPYTNILADNNTDINNDTVYLNFTAKPHNQCLHNKTITETTTNTVRKHNENTIKEILKAPREESQTPAMGNFKSDKKRSKKSHSKAHAEQDSKKKKDRVARNIPKNIEAKIFENKDRIYSSKGDSHNLNYNYDYYRPLKRGLRSKNWLKNHHIFVNKNSKKSADYYDTFEKRDDFDAPNLITTTPLPFFNYTEININTNNEQGVETSSETTTETESPCTPTFDPETYQIDEENEKMAEVVNGELASRIVSTVFDQMKNRASLKTKLSPGLIRKHGDFPGTIDFDILKTNESEDASEAQVFLEQLSKVLNKLVLTQVRRKMCQRLPDQLRQYLEATVTTKSSLPVNTFEPNTKQGDYLFTYEERKLGPPFDLKRLQEILLELEALLLSYHNLNTASQNRVELVKDYIEKHVKMLKRIIDAPSHLEPGGKKRHLRYNQDKGQYGNLERNREFVPNFDINRVIKSRINIPMWRSYKKREAKNKNNFQSEKYKKLQVAAQKIREKREYEKKIAEMFGGKQKRSVKKLHIGYEKPIVYSL